MKYISLLFLLLILNVRLFAQKDSLDKKSVIPSLTIKQYNAYKNGDNLELAKEAEINHFPDPFYVLSFEKDLGLTATQKTQIQAIQNSRKFKAVEMGRFILDQEKKLNELFSSYKINEGMLIFYTNKIGLYHGELKNAHLKAHYATRKILSLEQIKKYDKLRGISN